MYYFYIFLIYEIKCLILIFFYFLKHKTILSIEFCFIKLFSTHFTKAKLKHIKYHGLNGCVIKKSNS